jgi:Protein of unknown function (DUF3102)
MTDLDTRESKPVTTIPALTEHATAIRQLGKRVIADVIEIGRRLAECRRILKEDSGWRAWLEDELKWSPQTAGRFIQVYELSQECSNVEHLDLPVSALYLLAAPSTPEEARNEVIERAQAGEPVSVAETKRIVETAKGQGAFGLSPAQRHPTQPSEKKKRRTSEEIRVENFKNGLYFIGGLESLNGMVVPQQLSTEDADWAIEQIRCAEQALRALANRIKQVRSGPKLGDAQGDGAPDVGADNTRAQIPALADTSSGDPGPIPDFLRRAPEPTP